MDITFTLEVTGDESLLDPAMEAMVQAAEHIREIVPSLDKTAIVFYGDGILDTY